MAPRTRRRYMRTRRRAAIIVASAAALGVGLFAFTGSASALTFCNPPAPNATQGNQSCVNGSITPNTGLGGGARKNISLFTHVATKYLNPGNRSEGGFAKQVTVLYDSDGTINALPQGTAPKTHRCTVRWCPTRPSLRRTRPVARTERTPTCRRWGRSAARHPRRRRRTSAPAR